MSDDDPRPFWLHAERPAGHHAWIGPFTTVEAMTAQAVALLPHVPDDATWDIRFDTEGGKPDDDTDVE